MRFFEFEQFLRDSKDQLSTQSAAEKIHTFIEWCKGTGKEEVILRLSSEDKGGWGNNCFLDFTTTRIIISKKNFFRKFADVGYIAGIAPYPYILVSKGSKNITPTKVRKQSVRYLGDVINNASNFLLYSYIHNIVLQKGLKTVVRNILGTMVQTNFLTVNMSKEKEKYNFVLPVNKNGNFEEIYYWLKVVVPFDVSGSR